MTTDDLFRRIKRIHAAIGDATVTEIQQLPAQIRRTEKSVIVLQDFSGGLSDHQIENLAHSLISNTASLFDHLKKWAQANANDAKKVDAAFDASRDLKILYDLWNRDKHGGAPRAGGHSKESPTLTRVHRVLRLCTRPSEKSTVTLTLGVGGAPFVSGDGSANVVVTAEVIGQNGSVLGDLHEIAERGIKDWERLLSDFGVL